MKMRQGFLSGARRTVVALAFAGVMGAVGVGGPAAAQAPGLLARVTGVVTDESGAVLPGVTVVLTALEPPGQPLVQVTDSEGTFQFVDLPPGRYQLGLSLEGFEQKQRPIVLRAGEVVRETVALALAAFTEAVQVVAQATLVDSQRSPGESRLEERVLTAVPLAKERFEDALPLLPSVIRGPDGLLNMRGTRADQSVLLVNGVNGTDPVTGQFALRLPLEAVETLEVQTGVYPAEFGSATGAVANVVTRAGQDKWDVQAQSFLPRLRFKEGGIRGIDAFTPRVRVAGPLRPGRLWFAETVSYRFVRTRVNELEPLGLRQSEQIFESFDGLTQIDYALRSAHRLTGTLLWFPSEVDNLQLDTLHPADATPDLTQRGWSVAVTDRSVLGRATTMEGVVAVKEFDVATRPKGLDASEITVTGVRRNYFNRFERVSRRYDGAVTLTTSRTGLAGEHLVKIGASVARTSYAGRDASLPVLLLRADGSVAQRIDFVGDPTVGAVNTEVATFVEDRWTLSARASLQAGGRIGYDGIGAHVTFAPRVALAFRPFARETTVLKVGYGRFYDKLPLNVKDFPAHQRRRITVYDGSAPGSAAQVVDLANQIAPRGLDIPASDRVNIELDQLLTSRLVLRVAYEERRGRGELVVDPLPEALVVASRGRSRSRSLEITLHRRFSRRGELTASYVRATAEGHLNDFVSLFGTVRDPVIRPDEFSRQPFDVPHRVLAWGVIHLPRGITVAPTLEYRSGFPYTVLDELQQVVGSRNRGGRFPDVFTLDLGITKEVRLTKTRRARVGVQFFNLTNHFNPRDVQNNRASPQFGRFANSADILVRLKFLLLF